MADPTPEEIIAMMLTSAEGTPRPPAGSYTLTKEWVERVMEEMDRDTTYRTAPYLVSRASYDWGREHGIITEDGGLDMDAYRRARHNTTEENPTP